MIAGLVAILDGHAAELTETISQISRIPGVVPGDINDSARRLPVMIDSPDPDSLEIITRRLQQIPGVAFVDVVFIHFEDESARIPETQSGKPTSL